MRLTPEQIDNITSAIVDFQDFHPGVKPSVFELSTLYSHLVDPVLLARYVAEYPDQAKKYLKSTNQNIVESHILKILGVEKSSLICLDHLTEDIEDLDKKTNLSTIAAKIVETELKRFGYSIYEYLLIEETNEAKLEILLHILTGKYSIEGYADYYDPNQSINSQAVYIARAITKSQA